MKATEASGQVRVALLQPCGQRQPHAVAHDTFAKSPRPRLLAAAVDEVAPPWRRGTTAQRARVSDGRLHLHSGRLHAAPGRRANGCAPAGQRGISRASASASARRGSPWASVTLTDGGSRGTP
ncbi:MAG: hypothetical protein JWM66_876 [Solirubrobacterales bacterium]|nr:hypothetical protein [Solirubrobacterales bacterium]